MLSTFHTIYWLLFYHCHHLASGKKFLSGAVFKAKEWTVLRLTTWILEDETSRNATFRYGICKVRLHAVKCLKIILKWAFQFCCNKVLSCWKYRYTWYKCKIYQNFCNLLLWDLKIIQNSPWGVLYRISFLDDWFNVGIDFFIKIKPL